MSRVMDHPPTFHATASQPAPAAWQLPKLITSCGAHKLDGRPPSFSSRETVMPARKRKSKAPPAPRGREARRLVSAQPPPAAVTLTGQLQADGGAVLATFRDPLGGHWQLLAALPLDLVEPTPYQRGPSAPPVGRAGPGAGP